LKSLTHDFYDTRSNSDTNDDTQPFSEAKKVEDNAYGTQASTNSAFSLIHVVPTKSVSSYKVPLASEKSTGRFLTHSQSSIQIN
jgi:hypothetical protein